MLSVLYATYFVLKLQSTLVSISVSRSLYNNQVCQKVLHLLNAEICVDSICWWSLPRAPSRKVCYIPGIFPSWFTSPPFSTLYTHCACFSDRVSERLGDKLDWKHLFLLLCWKYWDKNIQYIEWVSAFIWFKFGLEMMPH